MNELDRTDAAAEPVDSADQIDESKTAPADRAENGPFDVSEVPAMRPYIDLGGIKVAPREGLQLRLEVDERSKTVVAVSIEYAGSLLQAQAFAAPKSKGLWARVRHELTAQLTSQGAQVTETKGPLGPEILVRTPVPADQGGGVRPTRFVAVDGPRWMLRGVMLGKAAHDDAARDQLLEVFRELVVVRGAQPMPPSELIPLKMPAGAQSQRPASPTAPVSA